MTVRALARLRPLLLAAGAVALAGCGTPMAADTGASTTPAVAASSGDSAARAAEVAALRAEFAAWLVEVRAEAIGQGVAPATVDRAFARVDYRPVVIERDRDQPEFVRTFWQYVGNAVTDRRVAEGRERYARHRALLDRVEAETGVPGNYIVAFWGLESAFGQVQGDHPVIASIATRAFERRGSGAFRAQLIDALKILDEGRVPETRLIGSWAGAMGMPQFMPSAYRQFAVDGDGDGFADIWTSEADTFHSIANYLAGSGWTEGERWGRRVVLPGGFDYGQADLDIRRPLDQWAALGVTMPDGDRLPSVPGMTASLVLPAGHEGPAYLVYANFRTILRYNNATFYALAIGTMADAVAGEAVDIGSPPPGNRSLTTDDIEEMQTLLVDLGYDAGPADGIPGSRTKAAIRAFQSARGLPADGHHSSSVLDALRRAAGRG
jgi:membrane-bound lytic murein transglycosylase B